MNKFIPGLLVSLLLLISCTNTPDVGGDTSDTDSLSTQNLLRAIELTDNAISNYFTGSGLAMARYYNPYTGTRSDEKGSVWMYTSSIEAVDAILSALEAQKEHGNTALYDLHFERYVLLLSKLYENADYYKGTYTLTSYTQTKQWSVYGVNRADTKGTASVDGVNNVYDDQQWFIKALVHAYKLTEDETYLDEAEYLTSYVLDGWDCTLDANGNEYGGITWGPGYTTKHSCSNGPIVSPLVWLYEIYKDKDDEISYIYIDTDNSRKTATMKKSDYYLKFAKAVYNWQKEYLLRSDGVYDDFMGGCDYCDVVYETINGTEYRKHTNLSETVGPPYSYNSGTMLSGAADLFDATGDSTYVNDIDKLTRATFSYFATKDENVTGYYTYDVTGFNDWFNNVLMTGYVDAYPAFQYTAICIKSFQDNLDYAYDNYLYKSMLPTNLLVGWSLTSSNNDVQGMFIFSFATEYATLAQYEIEK